MNENLFQAQYDVTKKSKLKKFYEANKILIFSIILILIITIVSASFYLEAKEKISLSSTAQLNGDLFATILVIEEGASFNGLCKMVSKSNNKSASSNKKVANLNEGSKN